MNKKKEEYLTITDLKEIIVNNFWLFLASVCITAFLGIGYIVVTPPTFKRSASILIKEDSKGKSINGSAQAFDEFGLLKTNTNINNEISILKAPFLMEEVVKRLKLDYNYSIRFKKVRWVDLYNGTPVKVELDSLLTNAYLTLNINILSEQEFSLSGFSINGHEMNDVSIGRFNEFIETELGRIKIIPTTAFTANSPGKEIHFTKSSINGTAGSLSSRLTVGLRDSDSSVIDLSITDGVGQRAEDVLNMLISVYNENWIKDKNQVTLSTSEFINERLKVIEEELGGVDNDISDFKSKNLLPDVKAVTNIQLQESSSNSKTQLALNNQLSMAQYIKKYLQDATTGGRLLPANSGIENNAIESQIERYNELLLQKDNLLANSSETNPIVADMITKLNAMKEILLLSINDLIGSLTVQIDNARREARLYDAKIASNPTQEKYLLSVERQQKVKEELYLFLLQKREEIELSQAFIAYNTRILVPAGGSKAPISPKRMTILVFSLVVGLLLPTLYLILKEVLNTHIQGKKDLEDMTAPFAGSIPLVTKQAKKKNKSGNNSLVVITEKSRDLVNDAFRVVRTNIDFIANGENKKKVLMFISFLPGSGKSFMTANLGISEAIKGSKVLIIDSDLRKASLSADIDSPKVGLSDYLRGKVNHIDEIIVKDQLCPNLDIIPVGTIPPNPAELLLTSRFGDLIAQMRDQYDYIYLDCTPVEILPDPSIVIKHCDMSVFVIRAGLTDKRLLSDLKQLYDSKRFKDMCVVLNGVKYTKGGYYYRSYGYYGSHGSRNE